jgi:hypothetical protein
MTTTAVAAVMVGRTLVVKGVRAVTTLTAAVVVACMRCSADSHCTESTSTKSLTKTAGAIADFFTLSLAVTADQFCCSGTNQCTLCKVTAVVGVVVIVAGLFANIDHAVIAAVVLVAITTAVACLGNGVSWAQLAARTSVIVLADSTMSVVVVWILVGFGAAHNVVVGFAGRVWIAGLTNEYTFSNGIEIMGLHSLLVAHGGAKGMVGV